MANKTKKLTSCIISIVYMKKSLKLFLPSVCISLPMEPDLTGMLVTLRAGTFIYGKGKHVSGGYVEREGDALGSLAVMI
jgi:hypothetical protein